MLMNATVLIIRKLILLLNIKYPVPVMISDDCCESSNTDAVTHQMNLLTQEGPQPEDIQHYTVTITPVPLVLMHTSRSIKQLLCF